MSRLVASHLAKRYGNRWVVEDVSIEVERSQVVGLLGPNGAGKTTCFYMIINLVKADKGRVWVNDVEISHLSLDARARAGIGYLPQEASVFRKMTVCNNIMAILETRKDLTKQQRQQQLQALLEDFSIGSIANNLGMSLSGGERRRVEIARALAANPQFILLDEPFAGVDPISVNEIKNIINQLKQRGLGVLITDHNVRETLDICEKAYIVGNGVILASGSTEEVIANQTVKNVYLGQEFRL